jgi:hypothetical protein
MAILQYRSGLAASQVVTDAQAGHRFVQVAGGTASDSRYSLSLSGVSPVIFTETTQPQPLRV